MNDIFFEGEFKIDVNFLIFKFFYNSRYHWIKVFKRFDFFWEFFDTNLVHVTLFQNYPLVIWWLIQYYTIFTDLQHLAFVIWLFYFRAFKIRPSLKWHIEFQNWRSAVLLFHNVTHPTISRLKRCYKLFLH